MTNAMGRPEADEYAPFYAGYVGRVPGGDVLEILAGQMDALTEMVRELSDDEANGRFAPGEWSIKEVIGHLIDAERAFSYRVFSFSRGEAAALPGFDQDAYVREADFDARALVELLNELTMLRLANLLAYRHLTPEIARRRGVASGMGVSVHALLYIMAGHLEYHLEDLREKYLPALKG